MVTAEIAVALPALVLVTALALWGVTAASVQLACTDGALSGARAAARGETVAAVRAVVIKALPAGASVRVHRDAHSSRVEIAVPVKAPGGARLPPLVIRADATAINEPGVGASASEGTRNHGATG
ncbi:TadE family type IV pilus minor pilin [Actinomadura viridis]|uniref:TadE family type IV pilus minor pilin n=1 Tax=Actinomadura viridis TaxID=58110 RepID=UPI0036A39859